MPIVDDDSPTLWKGEDYQEEPNDDSTDVIFGSEKDEKDDPEDQDNLLDFESPTEQEEDSEGKSSSRSWVEREFDTTKAVVREVLKEKEKARNSDKFLIWFIKHEVEGHDLNDFEEYKDSTNPETIRRVRQEIQNDEGKFLPTDAEVLKNREFKREEIRDYYSKSKMEEIFH